MSSTIWLFGVGPVIDTSEAAQILGITRARVWQLIRDGKLEGVRHGKRGLLVTTKSVMDRKKERET